RACGREPQTGPHHGDEVAHASLPRGIVARTLPERQREDSLIRGHDAGVILPTRQGRDYATILATTPEPTVRPPSRMVKRRPWSMAIGVISSMSSSALSPGMIISTPSFSLMIPVTSVVRK